MKVATFIKKLRGTWRGDARLYRLSAPVEYDKPFLDKDPPAQSTDHVIVSAAVAPFSGPETYIFPASSDGVILGWGELDGSFRGGLDHSEALMGAGFVIGREEGGENE